MNDNIITWAGNYEIFGFPNPAEIIFNFDEFQNLRFQDVCLQLKKLKDMFELAFGTTCYTISIKWVKKNEESECIYGAVEYIINDEMKFEEETYDVNLCLNYAIEKNKEFEKDRLEQKKWNDQIINLKKIISFWINIPLECDEIHQSLEKINTNYSNRMTKYSNMIEDIKQMNDKVEKRNLVDDIDFKKFKKNRVMVDDED